MISEEGLRAEQRGVEIRCIKKGIGLNSLLGGLRIGGFPPLPGFFAKIFLGRGGIIAGKSLILLFWLVRVSVIFLNLYIRVVITFILNR